MNDRPTTETAHLETNHMGQIAFRFAARKARAAIHGMLLEAGTLDLHTVLKTCYFADKAHLNLHNRPIFGATYKAMRFGPVPLEIYEMAKGEAYWLAELNADRYPWSLNGYRVHLDDNGEPERDVLSQSDTDALSAALTKSRSMTFSERTAVTHGPDWQAARMGMMSYEDMLDDTGEKNERIAWLREAGQHLRL
jgi:hypothetical protein